jgi:hypothetical protein
MFLAEISILNLGYLIFLHKDEIYKKNMKRSDKVSIILSILAILALSVFVEYGMGRLFQLFVIILGLCLINPVNYQFQDRLFYFLGVALVVGIYLSRSVPLGIISFVLFIALLIALHFIKKANPDKIEKYNSNLMLFIKAALLMIVLLEWSEYGKKPNVRYVKLFLKTKK